MPSNPRENTYPALLLAVCFGGGIALAPAFPRLDPTNYIIAGGICGAIAIWRLFHRSTEAPRQVSAKWTIYLFLLVLFIGLIHFTNQGKLPNDHLLFAVRSTASTHREPVSALTGTITTFPVVSDRYTRFILSVDTAAARSSRFQTTGDVQINLWKPYDSNRNPFRNLSYGQRVRIRGTPEEVLPPGNPADFDYRAYLARRNVYLTISTSTPSDIHLLNQSPHLSARILSAIRSYVRRAVESTIPTPDARAILLALLLGDRSQIEDNVRDQFRRTGLMHLLAISGLHVMMIGLVFYSLLLPVLKRLYFSWRLMEWTRSTVTMTILLIYCLITGAPASVVRALIMTAIVLGGVLAQRTYQPLNALGAAAIILLILNADELFDVGFQLSFAAVAGILIITPALNEMIPSRIRNYKPIRPVLSTIVVSTAATLATMPVTLYHFGQVAFGGLVLNTIAIPITAVVLSGAVATVLFFGPAYPAADLAGSTTDRAIVFLLEIAETGNHTFSWALVERSVQHPLLVLTMVAGILVVVLWNKPHIRWIILCTCISCLTAFTWLQILENRAQELDLIFFDVNQGDAALIQFPNERAVLIDGGNRSSFFDEGERTILPHLRRHGIERLAAVVISHGHRDHMGGIVTILRSISTDRIIFNGQHFQSEIFSEMVDLADSLQVPLQNVTAGDTLRFDPRVHISILAPLTKPAADADANDASVVLRLRYREITTLFTGDIERHSEERLVQLLPAFLAADVVKIPHHGSESSSTPSFVEAATASDLDDHTAIICAGRDNNFDHPHPEVVERWRSAGAEISLTMNGAVWLRTKGYALERVHWR